MENENLQNYLLEHELLMDEEQDEEFEPDDDLINEEIDRIKKKGGRSGIMTIGPDNTEEQLILDVTLHLEKQRKSP